MKKKEKSWGKRVPKKALWSSARKKRRRPSPRTPNREGRGKGRLRSAARRERFGATKNASILPGKKKRETVELGKKTVANQIGTKKYAGKRGPIA